MKLITLCFVLKSLDALAEFPATPVKIETPCGPCDGAIGPDPENICAVSIVRSGDALLEAVRDIEPAIRVGKILIQRDESHPLKLPTLFYSKLPPGADKMFILLCDPMLATGGSAIMAIETLVKKYNVDPEKIVFANSKYKESNERVECQDKSSSQLSLWSQ